jgi:hypothetical protein
MLLSSDSRKLALRTLRELTKSRFLAFIKERGFEADGTDSLTFRFRRKVKERHEMIEIQFDQYHRPMFVLNFGTVPSDGLVDAYGRLVEANNVRIFHLVERGRLYSRPRFLSLSGRWFRVGLGLGSPEEKAKLQVEKLIRLFSQVETWFASGAKALNLEISTWPQNAPGVAKKAMEARGSWPPEGWSKEDEKALRM